MVLSEDSYKELFDNFLNGIYFVDTDRRITYWNKGAERISGYTASEVVGHKCSDNILIHVDEQGRQLCMIDCPVAHTLDDQRVREAAVFLHHKAGHRIPVAVQVIPIRDASSRVIGAAEVFQDNSARFTDRETIGRLQKAALIDHLTGLPNRRYLEMKLQTCLDDLKRYSFPFGIIFADIDHFKEINDTIGHPMGDEVLRMVSHTLEANIRSSDLSGRWGGEEFVVVIQHLREEYLAAVANKLKALVEESSLSLEGVIVRVTMTLGATLARPDDTMESIMERADKLLYKGKASGRNRVVMDF